MKRNEIILELDPNLESDLITIAELKDMNFDTLVNRILRDFVVENYRLIKERQHLDKFTRLTLSTVMR